jgi:outer membrane protein OmpA-like peptidoglycan-associated protein
MSQSPSNLPFLFLFLSVGITSFSQSGDVENKLRIFPLPSINSEEREFSPVLTQGKLVFVTSQLNKGLPDPVSNEAYYDLLMTPLKKGLPTGKPKNFSLDINSPLHEGPCSFSTDGKKIFFSKSIQRNGAPVLDETGKIQLQIYEATFDGTNWGNVKLLSFNKGNDAYMHPAISPDGEKLYFSSNKLGGYGGFDIYFVEKEGDHWSEPINMGPEINSTGNEGFPYMPPNGVLFFASNGHKGLGGIDLYMIDISSNRWGSLLNLGAPINSSFDDFSIALKDYTTGFFSSNRPGGKGKDDIYAFESDYPLTGVLIQKKPAVPQIQFFDQKLGLSVEEVQVNFLDVENMEKWHQIYTSNANGIIQFQPFFDEDRWLKIQKTGYRTQEILLEKQLLGQEPRTIFILLDAIPPVITPVELPTVTEPPPMVVLPKTFTLDNLYYPYNDYQVPANQKEKLKELALALQSNPAMRIKISAHTDSRGSSEYNQGLSLKRALAIQQFLILKGVAAIQLKVYGYGESQLRNRCKDGVPCPESEHAFNRRVAFTVLEN